MNGQQIEFREREFQMKNDAQSADGVPNQCAHLPPPLWISFVVFLFLIASLSISAQVPEIDGRNVDTVILLDVSGSMVMDIRKSLLKERLATGQADFQFQIRRGDSVSRALRNPRVWQVLTNNLLFHSIDYLETLIDQHQPGNIYLATFDDGIRVLAPQKFGSNEFAKAGDHVLNGMMGPYTLGGRDINSDAVVRRKLKSFLATERNDVLPNAESWLGVLPEAVTKGSGPTALRETCLAAIDFLEQLRSTPGYTNSTRIQNLILLTDGLEEKDKKIPFSQTIARLKLQQEAFPFTFTLVYVLPEDEAPPQQINEINYQLKQAGGNDFKVELFRPRSITITATVDGTALSGSVLEPEAYPATADVSLSPKVRFQVEAADNKPITGKLKFSVAAEERLSNLRVRVVPSEVAIESLAQPIGFSVTIEGDLKPLFTATGRAFDRLILAWELLDAREAPVRRTPGNPPVYLKDYREPSLVARGERTLPIKLHLVPRMNPITIRSVRPAKPDLSSGERVVVSAAPRLGDIALFEVDFSKTTRPASVLARLVNGAGANLIRMSGDNNLELLLLSEIKSKREFSLAVDAPPGTYSAEATLTFAPQSERTIANTTNLQISAIFEPSVIKIGWSGAVGEVKPHPIAIDFGTVYMRSTKPGSPQTAGPVSPRGIDNKVSVNSFSLEIPENSVSPAAEYQINGSNALAFRGVVKGDVGDADQTVFGKSVQIEIQSREVPMSVERPTETNLWAVLEIRPRANYVFEYLQPEAASVVRTNVIRVPLKMRALVQPWEGLNKPK